MGKRKRKRIYIDGDGKEYTIEGSVIDLSKGSLDELIGDALDAEQDDKIIKQKSKEIRNFLKNIDKKSDKLKDWYNLGKLLQFVDGLNLKGEENRNEAFRRLFQDLKSSPIWNTSDSKIIRYPQHMYTLYKLPKELVFHKGMTWARWFDILEYRKIIDDKNILEELVIKCCKENWNEDKLRSELQIINKILSKNEK